MLDFISNNDGHKEFNKPENQTWDHQKKYLIDIFNGISKLLDLGIAMTDLKPGNTLYDPEKRIGSLISLGGAQKTKNKEELSKFDMTKFSG